MSPSKGNSAPTSVAVQVLEILPNVPTTVRFLGSVLGLLSHWHCGRSHPCPGPNECSPTIHRSRTVWRGYAPAEVWDESRRLWFPGVQSVTEALEEVLRGRTLRGEVWLLTRSQEGRKQGPVKGEYCERQAEECLSPIFDVLPVLLRFYHVSSLLLGVQNPMPSKIVLGPAAGPAPKLPADYAPSEPEPLSKEEKKRISDEFAKLSGRRRPGASTGAPSDNGNGHAAGPGR